MRAMKRIATLSFGLLLALSLAACGKKAAPAQPAQPADGSGSASAEPAQPEPAPEAPADQPAAGGGW